MHPAVLTESQTLTGFIDEMLQGIRNAAFGLTDDEARLRPTRSALSIAGLIKHATWVMRMTVPHSEGGGRRADPGTEAGRIEFFGSFTPTEPETLTNLLADFDDVRQRYVATIAAMDPNAVVTAGPQPWDDQPDAVDATQRMLLVHHVDEFARHAGHADIIREQLDGATAMPLRLAVEGRAGNAYVRPWTRES